MRNNGDRPGNDSTREGEPRESVLSVSVFTGRTKTVTKEALM